MKNIQMLVVLISALCFLIILKAGSAGGPTASLMQTDFSSAARVAYMPGQEAKLDGKGICSDWVLCYEADEIYIYERWISAGEHHNIRERKGEMYVGCSFDEAVTMLGDYERVKSWTADVKSNTLIKKTDAAHWITYTEFNLPWPFQNRDVVSEYHMSTVKPGSQVLIKINSLDNLVLQKEGITRISNYNASWAIKRINEEKVWICFIASCDAPLVVPRIVQDPVVRSTFHKNLLKLHNTLENKHSQCF